MYKYINSLPGGKRTRMGITFYEDLKSEFRLEPGNIIYLSFLLFKSSLILKFLNNLLETEYDRMRRANQAAQAMLNLAGSGGSGSAVNQVASSGSGGGSVVAGGGDGSVA